MSQSLEVYITFHGDGKSRLVKFDSATQKVGLPSDLWPHELSLITLLIETVREHCEGKYRRADQKREGDAT